jgi:hypothetical protein
MGLKITEMERCREIIYFVVELTDLGAGQFFTVPCRMDLQGNVSLILPVSYPKIQERDSRDQKLFAQGYKWLYSGMCNGLVYFSRYLSYTSEGDKKTATSYCLVAEYNDKGELNRNFMLNYSDDLHQVKLEKKTRTVFDPKESTGYLLVSRSSPGTFYTVCMTSLGPGKREELFVQKFDNNGRLLWKNPLELGPPHPVVITDGTYNRMVSEVGSGNILVSMHVEDAGYLDYTFNKLDGSLVASPFMNKYEGPSGKARQLAQNQLQKLLASDKKLDLLHGKDLTKSLFEVGQERYLAVLRRGRAEIAVFELSPR